MAAYGDHKTAFGTSGSAAPAKPDNLAEGDLLVAFIGKIGSAGTLTTPTDWTLMASHTGGDGAQTAVYAKIADADDVAASSFTFSHSAGTADVHAVLYRITGTFAAVNNIYTIVIQSGAEQSDDVYRYATGITPNVASSFLILWTFSTQSGAGQSNASAYTLETSNPTWTERVDDDLGGDELAWTASATAVRTETTATGYYQVSHDTGGNVSASIGVLLAISDTQNGSPTINVINSTLGIQAPAAITSVQVSPSVISATATVNAPTATGGTNDNLWKNSSKPSPGSWLNQNKPA